MKKVLGMMFGLTLILGIGGMTSVKAATAENCEVYTNYYFFIEAETTDYYLENLSETSTSKVKTFYTTFNNNLPDDFVFVGSGIVPLDRTTSTISTSAWGINQFYSKYKETANNSNKLIEGNISYFVHGDWSNDGINYGNDNLDISQMSNTTIANGSILSHVDNVVVNSGNTLKPQSAKSSLDFSVTRTVTLAEYTAQVDNTIASGDYDWLLEPGLYYIQYKSCNTDTNIKTADIPIYIVWGIGIMALGYAVYYFMKYYKKPSNI